MRFEIVTDTFAPDINGVSMTLGRLVEGLRSRGHLVHVIRTGAAEDGETGVRSVRLPGYKDVKVGLPRPIKFRKRWAKKRPDAIYVATESPLGVSALRAANGLDIAVVCGFHTNFHEYLEKYRLGGLQPAAMRWLRSVHSLADCTLTPSSDVKEVLDEHRFENVELLGRGVDTDLFSPDRRSDELRRQWGARPNSPVAIIVGRVAAEKNFDLAIRCFEAMRERIPDVQCVVVGDGPIREKLEAKHSWIHFAGMQEGEDLAAHYAAADVMIFPSETETFGNVLLEGMASGLICVSYDYAASAVHVRHGDNGLKVPKGEADEFFKCALVAMDLRGFARLRERARESALQNGWGAVIDKFESCLVNLASVPKNGNHARRKKSESLKFRSIFISDVHLGIPESKVKELVDFLKHTHCENLYLNGDIIDGWALKRGGKWSKQHTKVVRAVLKLAEKRDVNVYYTRGNHDDILESFLPMSFGKIQVMTEVIHKGVDGKRYLVIHGDGFDQVVSKYPWMAHLGAWIYDSLLQINRVYNSWRRWRGKGYYSLSKKIKSQVKGAVSFVGRYEEQLQNLAKRRGCDGIICGHIHTPEDKTVGDVRYLNSGDWVESMSAVVEHEDGKLEVLYYDEFLERLGTVVRMPESHQAEEKSENWEKERESVSALKQAF